MSQVDDILLPLPTKGISHAVVFFDQMPPSVMTSLTAALQQDYPNLQPLNPKRWGAASVPRPISFGEVLSDDPDGGCSARPSAVTAAIRVRAPAAGPSDRPLRAIRRICA